MISSKGISTAQRLNCSLYIFFMLGILLRNSSTLMTVLEPFSLSCSCLMLPQSLAPFVCLFSYWQSSFCKDHWFDFWFKIFFLCKFHGPFFGFEILIFSWVAELLEKVLAFSLKLDLMFSHQTIAEEVVFVFLTRKVNSFLKLQYFLEWWGF